MPQTVWKGSISFGLVSIPVRLTSATEERDVSFRQVHAQDGGRIRYKRVCEIDGAEVPYADIAKGYELEDGAMVILTDEDLADLPVASSKVVDVQTFVPLSEIDPTALSRAYYAEPAADPKPYILLRDALEKSGQVAVVKVALRNRERLAVLRPREGVLTLQTMLWPDEVRRPDFRFLDDDVQVRPQEMAMAESYIETLSGDFEPEAFVDEYRTALEEVVRAKVAGREVSHAPAEPTGGGQVVDLMEALRRSVAEARSRRAGGEAATGPATDAAGRTPEVKPERRGAAKQAMSPTRSGHGSSSKSASRTSKPASDAPAEGSQPAAAKKTAGAKKAAPGQKAAPARKTATTKKAATRKSA